MSQKWKGDREFTLPAGMIEPYRLWFEYLRLALQDPDIDVDELHYADWGKVLEQNFKAWWQSHWRDLFAVRSVVEVVPSGSPAPDTEGTITLALPLSGRTDDILEQVAAHLNAEGVNLEQQGRFALTLGYERGFLKQMDKARRYLRLYGYWLKHADCDRRKRVDRAARDYVRWYAGWEAKLRAGSNRSITPMPYFYKTYVGYLDAKLGRKVSGGGQAAFEGGNAENARRQIVRDIKTARRIAENVARGEFPGGY